MAFMNWRVEIISLETDVAVDCRNCRDAAHAIELSSEVEDEIDSERYYVRLATIFVPDNEQ